MRVMFIYKLQIYLEYILVLLAIWLQPVAGAISAFAATLYFLSMLKHNVINPHYGGSWKRYFMSIIKK
jgi:hypothetical protein